MSAGSATTDLAVADAELARLQTEIAHLRRENIRLTGESELLRAAARIVVEELDTRILIQEIARLAASVLTADHVLIGLCDEDVFHQETGYSHGVGATKETGISSDPVAKWVLIHRAAFLSNNPVNDPRLAAAAATELPAYRNVLAVPILNHQRLVIGCVEAQNRRTGVFTERDRNAAETLALLASTGLSRAKLYDRMQEWSRSLEMLLAFNAAVNQHLDPKALVEKLVENAAQFSSKRKAAWRDWRFRPRKAKPKWFRRAIGVEAFGTKDHGAGGVLKVCREPCSKMSFLTSRTII